MGQERQSPFTPDWGKVPLHRAGHEEATRDLFERVDSICAREAGDGVVLYGPRGTGKTVLLDEVGARAVDQGAWVRWLVPGDWEDTVDDFVRGLPTGLTSDPGLKAKIEMNLGFLNVGVEHRREPPYQLVAQALRVLSEAKPVLLVADDAHEMPPKIAKALLGAVQRCIIGRLPVLLVLAGAPRLDVNLGLAGASYRECTHPLRIGRLESRDAIRGALSIPAEMSGLPFAEEALGLVAAESHGHPFFIQLLGDRAWRAAIARDRDATRIGLEDAQVGVDMAAGRRDAFYGKRLLEVTKRKVTSEALAVAKAFTVRDGARVLSRKELGAALRPALAEGRSVDDAIRELFALGLVWQTENHSLWEQAIPSLCDYIAEHAVID